MSRERGWDMGVRGRRREKGGEYAVKGVLERKEGREDVSYKGIQIERDKGSKERDRE